MPSRFTWSLLEIIAASFKRTLPTCTILTANKSSMKGGNDTLFFRVKFAF